VDEDCYVAEVSGTVATMKLVIACSDVSGR
jgi:hypothetical protein